MKTPSHLPDPLLQSLTEEAAYLPLEAAAEARRTHELRREQKQRLALIVTALCCGLYALKMVPSRDANRISAAAQAPAAVSVDPVRQAQPPRAVPPATHWIVRTEEQARQEPLPLPEGLTHEQENVLIAARGLPLLLVRDSSGKVARIHVIER
jgi:hypothetical protein